MQQKLHIKNENSNEINSFSKNLNAKTFSVNSSNVSNKGTRIIVKDNDEDVEMNSKEHEALYLHHLLETWLKSTNTIRLATTDIKEDTEKNLLRRLSDLPGEIKF